MNIIAEGLVSVLMISIFGSKGKSAVVDALPAVNIPVIKDIPILNTLFSGYTGLAYLLFAVMVIAWIVIYKMPAGIRLRATGINDTVVDSLGLRSGMIKYVAVGVCGALSALGGAFLSLSQLNFYSKDMVAGRGYIALAIFVFARKNPIYCVLVSILFGLTETIQLRMQVFPIPTQFLAMISYLCTLIMLLCTVRNKKKKKEIMLKNSAVIEQIRKEAAAFFEQDYSGHDMQHTMRVYSTAVRIAEKEGADMVLTAITALLHDVDDRKIIGRQGKTENAAFILKKAGVDREKAERICRNIEKISFRGTGETIPDDPEGRIVQDADRLDAMGAIGIARVFAYAEIKDSRFLQIWKLRIKSLQRHIFTISC